jgi:type VI secretion system protein ImpJ
MSWRSKVVWTQGMFLLPHHFQQEARYVEHLVDLRVRAAGPFAWGFATFALDESQLELGRIGLVRASGVLPDGTPFLLPQVDALPAPFEVPTDMKNEQVVLAAPVTREGQTEVTFNGAEPDSMARYHVNDESLRDHSSANDDPEPIQTGSLRLRLMRARDAGEGYATLGIARVAERRGDGPVVLDRTYVPPQTRLDTTAQLSAMASLLHGLVQQRAQLLAARMGQLSHGVSEMADFLMLQALNRATPVFHQHANAPHGHPRELHQVCLQLAGDLATFSSVNRHPPEYPLYKHDDLQGSFAPILADLRRMLSTVLERNAQQIELTDRTHGVRTAVIPDQELARTANFIIAVNAQMPAEQLRQRFPAQSKLGPVDRIRDLVNLQLPGVGLRSLPVAPRQLPFHAGYHYFELDRGGDLWKQLERNGSLALHVAGDFPGLELELWAIRQ